MAGVFLGFLLHVMLESGHSHSQPPRKIHARAKSTDLTSTLDGTLPAVSEAGSATTAAEQSEYAEPAVRMLEKTPLASSRAVLSDDRSSGAVGAAVGSAPYAENCGKVIDGKSAQNSMEAGNCGPKGNSNGNGERGSASASGNRRGNGAQSVYTAPCSTSSLGESGRDGGSGSGTATNLRDLSKAGKTRRLFDVKVWAGAGEGEVLRSQRI